MKEWVDPNAFQETAVAAFAAGVDHNSTEATHMFISIQSDQRVTDAAVGTTPDGYATIFPLLEVSAAW